MTYRWAWIDLTLFLFSLFITLFKAALPRFISVKYFSIVYRHDVFFVNNTSIEWSDSFAGKYGNVLSISSFSIARYSCGDGTLRRRRGVNGRKSTASDKILNGIKYQNTASVIGRDHCLFSPCFPVGYFY